MSETRNAPSSECLSSFTHSAPDLALLMPCTSRRHILGTRSAEELAPLLEHRSRHPEMRLFGMYAYGEIGPLSGFGKTTFHNDTFALLLMGEET